MKLEIKERKKDELMSRERISAYVEYESATPSRLELKKALAKKLNADDSLLIIRHIYPRFGLKKSKIIAHLYKDEKKMLLFEGKQLIEKNREKKKEAEGQAEEGQGKESAKPEQTEKQNTEKDTKKQGEEQGKEESKESDSAKKGNEEEKAQDKQQEEIKKE